MARAKSFLAKHATACYSWYGPQMITDDQKSSTMAKVELRGLLPAAIHSWSHTCSESDTSTECNMRNSTSLCAICHAMKLSTGSSTGRSSRSLGKNVQLQATQLPWHYHLPKWENVWKIAICDIQKYQKIAIHFSLRWSLSPSPLLFCAVGP